MIRHSISSAILMMMISSGAAAAPQERDAYVRHELLDPATSKFHVVYETSVIRPKAQYYFNTVQKGTVVSDIRALDVVVVKAQNPPRLARPLWAYAVPPEAINKPAVPPTPFVRPTDDGKTYTVPGSTKQLTRVQINFGAADWFPGEHPPMSKIVEFGDADRKILACALCHYPTGKGQPHSAPVAGLSTNYLINTLNDFKNGDRLSSEPLKAQHGNTAVMARIAKALTDDEIKQVAAYFSAIPWTQWVKVVESQTAPKVKSINGVYRPLTGAEAGTEPLGDRIVEVPVDTALADFHDPHSGFIAYVPVGSVAKGKALVTTGGGGKTFACAACHGTDLKGADFAPRLASRSPSYLARQLNDFRTGARKGKMASMMAPVVNNLTDDDLLYISAYLASIPAPPGRRTEKR